MSPKDKNPKTLSEAITQLDQLASQKKSRIGSSSLNISIENELKAIQKSIAELQPHLQNLQGEIAQSAEELLEETMEQLKTKINQGKKNMTELGRSVEEKIQKNPWWALGLIGLIALLIGFLIGKGTDHRKTPSS
ncbi:MAG: hypothetical protein K1X29_00595 [Bdellovibrionales bacterium]|nr:hypothetical protein [Bdellovibrionales bacterium]